MTAPLRSLARYAAPGFFVLGTLIAGCSRAPVAEVNGVAISRAELDRQVRVFLSVRPGAVDDDGTRRQVLDQLIKQSLLVQAARKDRLDQDPERQRLIAEKRKSLREELTKSIADQQAQLGTLDDAVETKVLIDAYSQTRRPGITVTAQDLKNAYDLRAQAGALPPLSSIRDQLLEQVLLDKLVEEVRHNADVKVHLDALR